MAAHVKYKVAFAVLLVAIALSTIGIIISKGPRKDPALAQLTKQIESNIAAQNEQSASMNFIGGPTGDDNLRAINEAKAKGEKIIVTNFIIILVTCLDFPTLITLIGASRARTKKVLFLLALIAAMVGELVVMFTHPAYAALSFFPHRVVGQIIVALGSYLLFCKYEEARNRSKKGAVTLRQNRRK